MTPNEFVKLYIQNCQYENELSLMAAAIAEENGLVVVFGASDDLCEIRGAEDDEIDCFDGGEATIAGAKVKINWCKDGYSWTYDTDIPHECFDVYEDGEKYCRGIVFSISDVRLPAADVTPVKHGNWKKGKGNERPTASGFVHDDKYICSCCGWSCCCEEKLDWNFYPNCGAKMDGGENL
jgi:hypothetical protein